jgi:TrmH family RNA methyltransferase
VNSITSRRNPIVKRYREVADGEVQGLLLLDGPHLIEEAEQAQISIQAIACSPRGLDLPGVAPLLERLLTAGVPTWSVTDEVMRAMSPVQSPAGIVALAERPTLTLAQALARAPQLVLVAAGVQDPGNVGAIVRAAEAGGATAAVFAGATADPFGWKALRGSMGSSFRLPVVACGVSQALAAARAIGLRVVATTARGTRSLFDADLRGPLAFFVGGEGAGLPDGVIQAADETIRIPMRKPVESLNVAVASALLVYEASRQRIT